MSSYSISSALKQTLRQTTLLAFNDPPDGYDAIIKFLSAKNLPRTNVVGNNDPYFIAKIDNQISYSSTIISNTSSPTWTNEEWIVRNIPSNAKLTVKIYNKDDDKILDDYIGRFDVSDLINYTPSSKGHEIIGVFTQQGGYFHLYIHSMRSSNETKDLPRYTFDGPCRYFRHNSCAIGRLTALNDNRIYSTFKIQMRRISYFFPPYERQHWNKEHAPARAIFANGPLSLASQTPIKLAHKILYGQTLKHNENGQLTNANDLWKSIFTDPTTKKIKPGIYTYVIDDNTWRFSETGVAFFTDFASKHALLANCSEHVRYAGEFHLRPKYGWDKCDDEWELVFDNGSGTYSPNPELLNNLKKLLEFNFPGLNVVTHSYKDPKLIRSVKLLRIITEDQ